MEYLVKQTKSGLLVAEFEIMHNNQLIAKALMQSDVLIGTVWQYYNSNSVLKYKLTYKPAIQLANIAKKYSEKVYDFYEIENGYGEICGNIKQQCYNGGFLNKYEYYNILLNDRVYTFYAIGFGKTGNKFPIYEGDKQIALIEKMCEVRNNLDEYLVTAIDENSAELASLVSLYVDSEMYANRGEIVTKGFTKTYNVSFNKELKSKYNPKFKENITK